MVPDVALELVQDKALVRKTVVEVPERGGVPGVARELVQDKVQDRSSVAEVLELVFEVVQMASRAQVCKEAGPVEFE